ncbi:MAG: protein kinase [Myxococcales bacterium]
MANVGTTICHGCNYTEVPGEVGKRCPRCGLAFVPIPEHKSRPTDAYLGRVIAGRYPIVGFVGAGTQGSVYRALQEPVGREVVIKLIHPSSDDDPITDSVRERFVREAKIVSRLSSPSTVTLHDYGVDTDGTLFMVLEYLKGRTLARLLAAEKFLNVSRAVAITYQVLQSLAEAHSLGLVHRDLKPANLMVVKGPFGEDQVRVLDFGVARAESRDLSGRHTTKAGTLIGTPRYMSPEQARGETADARSDLYAAGVMLYELLCGTPPFGAADPMEALIGHLEGKVPPLPPEYNVPPALEVAVFKALAKDPAQRFQSAMEMAKAIMDAREHKDSNPSAVVDAIRASPRDAMMSGATSTLIRDPEPAPSSAAAPAPIALIAPAASPATAVAPAVVTNVPPRSSSEPPSASFPAKPLAPIPLDSPAPEAVADPEEPSEEPAGRSPVFYAVFGVACALAILAGVWFVVLRPKPAKIDQLIPDPVAPPSLPAKLPSQLEPRKPEATASPEEPAKPEVASPEAPRPEPSRPEPARPEPAKVEQAKPEPSRPEPAPPEPAPIPAPKPTVGYLHVTCKPACSIYLNGDSKGMAPLKGLPLKPGEYLLWVKDPTSGAKDQRAVTIRAGQHAREKFELGP